MAEVGFCMKNILKRLTAICICAVLFGVSFLTPVTYADSDVYELTFDNLFIFEQWANHANLKVHDGAALTMVH